MAESLPQVLEQAWKAPAQVLEQAWELCYLDGPAAGRLGRAIAEAGGPEAAEGWLHVALAEARTGDDAQAGLALERAHAGFAAAGDTRGLALCGEVQAMRLLRAGDYAGASSLHDRLDQQAPERAPLHDFLAHNSRAIATKLLGRSDDALRHFYAACEAAERSGCIGPRVTALSNLGGFHHDLYNLEDAAAISEQALVAATQADARQALFNCYSNLIAIDLATGENRRARERALTLRERLQALAPEMLGRYTMPLALGHLAAGEIDEALACLAPGAISVPADGDGKCLWAWVTARCLLARNDADGARRIAEQTLQERDRLQIADRPYDLMSLHRVLADAAEMQGDVVAALAFMRRAHALYAELVGRSVRARRIALQVKHQLAEAQRQRDVALENQRSVENDHRRLAELNAALKAQMAETEMLHQQLREQALRDPLTGLHNRRYLFEIAPGMLELARRMGTPLCVVLLDLDHFKLLNDTCGHAAGDLVLQRFSALLTQTLRRSDVVARHGGEEFVAVMPDIDQEAAQLVLSRLLEAFQEQHYELGRRRLPRGSFSAGVAVFPRHGNTLEQLLSRADRGLYSAKNHGRARIELAPATGFGTLI